MIKCFAEREIDRNRSLRQNDGYLSRFGSARLDCKEEATCHWSATHTLTLTKTHSSHILTHKHSVSL